MSARFGEPIAVVGLGVRAPRAEGPLAFWNLLAQGVSAVDEIPRERWLMDSLHSDKPDQPGTIRHRRAALLHRVEAADPAALRLPRRELRHMDPQHRLLLECAWHAIEDAGVPFSALAGSRTGVFVGINFSDFQKLLAREKAAWDGYALLGTTTSFAANRISYAFDLRGPSTCVSVGCASSAVALHQACQSLLTGETEFALAGGAELMLSPDVSVLLSQAGVLSPQGQCRTLDARADGYVRGEGVGMVALKPLSKLAPEDRVYAVLCGSAVNSNGRNEWIMAASEAAQKDVIHQACACAGIDPRSIEYVEMHGSAFPRGDAAEAAAIGKALGAPNSRHPVRLGALSNNLGYQGAAGGIMQLIKVCLSLHHATFAPTIGVDEPSPLIAFSELGLNVQSALEPWPSHADGTRRRAGIISTSLGGVNAFVILEEAPQLGAEAGATSSAAAAAPAFVLVLSAHTQKALRQRARQLQEFLEASQEREPALADICYTAALRRDHQRHRAAVIARGKAGLLEGLQALLGDAAQLLWTEPGCAQSTIAAVQAFVAGGELAPGSVEVAGRRCVSLPVYPFQRETLWPEWLTPAVVTGCAESSPALPRRHAADSRPAQRETDILAFLRREVAQLLDIDESELARSERSLFEFGLNSVGISILRERIARGLGVSVLPTLFFERPRIELLAEIIAERLSSEAAPGGVDATQAIAGGEDERAAQLAELSEEETLALLQKKLAELES